MKTLVFDMDGTFVDLYNVNGWLEMLRAENTIPYLTAHPMYDMDTFNTLLSILKDCGWHIVITTWLSKNSSKDFENKTRKAKLAWLKKYNVPYDEIHMVSYGTDKASCTSDLGGFQILFDDNADIRKLWNLGKAVDANQNLLEKLADLIIG